MSSYITIPDVTYEVTTLKHTLYNYTAMQFHEQLADDDFIVNIQMFKRYLWKTDGKHMRRYDMDQEPCLIVKKVVPLDEFDFYQPSCASLCESLQNQAYEVYYPDYFAINYAGQAEPIVRGTKLFSRNLKLLLPQTPTELATHIQIENGAAFAIAREQRCHAIN